MKHLKDIMNKMGSLRQSMKNAQDFYNAKILERQIHSFLKKNYIIKDIKITYNNNFFEVSSNSDVRIKNNNIKSLTNGLFKWTEVKKDFDISYSDNITSLEGAPESVGRDFNCNSCKSLVSLEGAPEKVGRDFNCDNCSSLVSLEGAPKEVGKIFSYRNCKGKFTDNDAKKVTKAYLYNGDSDFTDMLHTADILDKYTKKSSSHTGKLSKKDIEKYNPGLLDELEAGFNKL